jgi:DeoR/GlpR family transcriptional regulator of sugar metabolism
MADNTSLTDPPARGRRRRASGASDGRQNLLAEPRRMKILEWLQEEGSARVRDLSVAFGVSEATVRQDLERLDSDGYITREHGGAFLKSVPQQVQSMSLHHIENMDQKRRIGQAAAELVGDQETIIIDSGTTTTQFADNLKSRQGLNIITNALNIALMLGANPTNTVHMPAGQFKAPTLSLSGEKSSDFFVGIYAEKLFLATAGISFEAGLTYPAIGDIYVKRAMIKAASKVYLLADSTKIGRTSFSSLGSLDMVDTLITDDGISDVDRRGFEERGIKLIVAR